MSVFLKKAQEIQEKEKSATLADEKRQQKIHAEKEKVRQRIVEETNAHAAVVRSDLPPKYMVQCTNNFLIEDGAYMAIIEDTGCCVAHSERPFIYGAFQTDGESIRSWKMKDGRWYMYKNMNASEENFAEVIGGLLNT